LTHAICTLALALAAAPQLAPLAVAGALLPDVLDRALRLRHRSRATHELVAALALAAASPLLPPLLPLALGWAHHLLLDSLTVQGVYVLGRRVSLSRAKSCDPLLNAAAVVVHLALLLA